MSMFLEYNGEVVTKSVGYGMTPECADGELDFVKCNLSTCFVYKAGTQSLRRRSFS